MLPILTIGIITGQFINFLFRQNVKNPAITAVGPRMTTVSCASNASSINGAPTIPYPNPNEFTVKDAIKITAATTKISRASNVTGSKIKGSIMTEYSKI